MDCLQNPLPPIRKVPKKKLQEEEDKIKGKLKVARDKLRYWTLQLYWNKMECVVPKKSNVKNNPHYLFPHKFSETIATKISFCWLLIDETYWWNIFWKSKKQKETNNNEESVEVGKTVHYSETHDDEDKVERAKSVKSVTH